MNAAFAAELDRLGPGRSHAPFDLPRARAYCRRLTLGHYENFTVASLLLPRRLLRHFHAVYAYCRWADDLADEAGGGDRALDLLAWWRDELLACYDGRPTPPRLRRAAADHRTVPHPAAAVPRSAVGVRAGPARQALSTRSSSCSTTAAVPPTPSAGWCCTSARRSTKTRAALSDCICTALQLANFWQDVSRDFDIGRVYLPEEDRRRFGYGDDDLEARRFTPAFAELMRFEVERTRALFERGRPLIERDAGRPAHRRGVVPARRPGGPAQDRAVRLRRLGAAAGRLQMG